MHPSTQQAPWQVSIEKIIAHPSVQATLVALILLNAAILGMQTSHAIMEMCGQMLHTIDEVILGIFIVELASLMAARGKRFFSDPWCVFDFLVIAIALVPATGSLSVLRALRVLRVLRLVNKVESMRKVVAGLLHSLPSLGSVFGLVIVVFYVFSVIATDMFGATFPQLFGDLGTTAFTLFQVMTLESWSEGVARPVMELFPYAWVFFVLFILIATFVIINLFIAVIVDSISTIKPVTHTEDPVTAEIRKLREEVSELRRELSGR